MWNIGKCFSVVGILKMVEGRDNYIYIVCYSFKNVAATSTLTPFEAKSCYCRHAQSVHYMIPPISQFFL